MFKYEIWNDSEKVGSVWYRPSMMAYSWVWLGFRRDGWTIEGIQKWCDRMDYQLISVDK